MFRLTHLWVLSAVVLLLYCAGCSNAGSSGSGTDYQSGYNEGKADGRNVADQTGTPANETAMQAILVATMQKVESNNDRIQSKGHSYSEGWKAGLRAGMEERFRERLSRSARASDASAPVVAGHSGGNHSYHLQERYDRQEKYEKWLARESLIREKKEKHRRDEAKRAQRARNELLRRKKWHMRFEWKIDGQTVVHCQSGCFKTSNPLYSDYRFFPISGSRNSFTALDESENSIYCGIPDEINQAYTKFLKLGKEEDNDG